MSLNSRETILHGDNYDYRTVLISSRDRVGNPTSDPLNCVINYNFNFEGARKLSMKKFTWVASQPPLTASFMAYIKSVALTKWDTKNYQNSTLLGPSIFDSIPMSAVQYLPTYPPANYSVYFYEPINLSWHYFSDDNTVSFIDFQLLAIQGSQWPVDTSITYYGEWDMEILIGISKDNMKGRDKDLSRLYN